MEAVRVSEMSVTLDRTKRPDVPGNTNIDAFFLILAFLQHTAEYVALRSVTEAHHVFTASKKYRLLFSGMRRLVFWYQMRIRNFSLRGGRPWG
jgi:hypothetical protein